MPIDRFIQIQRCPTHVDILHLSPPCQFFSPAHTKAGRDDETNIAALYSCLELIKKCKPRFITLEETFGITHDQHTEHFAGLISQFTDLGFSVRWKVVRLCTWGSSQDRKRLIIIAAAAGERLPPFPDPTHSERGGRGLKSFNTIDRAISVIRRSDRDVMHNLHTVQKFCPPKEAYDGNRLAGTICTGSNGQPHPSGRRDFTLRELACLQGFPISHKFVGTMTQVRRQIGNAFPPNTVEVLYKHLHEWLLKEDGRDSAQPNEDVIMIDSGSDMPDSPPQHRFFGPDLSPEMEEVIVIDDDDGDVGMESCGVALSVESDFVVIDLA